MHYRYDEQQLSIQSSESSNVVSSKFQRFIFDEEEEEEEDDSNDITEYDTLPCQTIMIKNHERCALLPAKTSIPPPSPPNHINKIALTNNMRRRKRLIRSSNDHQSPSSSLLLDKSSQSPYTMANIVDKNDVLLKKWLFWLKQHFTSIKHYCELFNLNDFNGDIERQYLLTKQAISEKKPDLQQIIEQCQSVLGNLDKHNNENYIKETVALRRNYRMLKQKWNLLQRIVNLTEERLNSIKEIMKENDNQEQKYASNSKDKCDSSTHRSPSILKDTYLSVDLTLPERLKLTMSLLENLRRQEDILGKLNDTISQLSEQFALDYCYVSESKENVTGRLAELNKRWQELTNNLLQHITSLKKQFCKSASFTSENPISTTASHHHHRCRRRLQSLANIAQQEKVLTSTGSCSRTKYFGFDMQGSVQYPWRRFIASSNELPFYVNVKTRETIVDHPEMIALMDSLSYFNEIRFCAYRTAIKMRAVQKRLCMDLCDLKSVATTIDSELIAGRTAVIGAPATLPVNETIDTTIVTGARLVTMIRRIYERAAVVHPSAAINVPLATDLCLNWLLNLFDENRKGFVKLTSMKIALAVMSQAHLEEKYKYMFESVNVSGHVDGISIQAFSHLIENALAIPKWLGEVAAFGGSRADPSVQCITKFMGVKDSITSSLMSSSQRKIPLDKCLSWMNEEPQSLVWLPVLHRLVVSEHTMHQAKCNICKQFPMIGFRYRSLRRFNFDVCQRCFLFSKQNNRFHIDDPLHEYYLETTSSDTIKDFVSVIVNKLKKTGSTNMITDSSHCGVAAGGGGSLIDNGLRKLGYLPLPRSFDEARPLSSSACDFLIPQTHKPIDLETMLSRVLIKSQMGTDEVPVPHSNARLFERTEQAMSFRQAALAETTIDQLETENRQLRDEYHRLTDDHCRNCSFIANSSGMSNENGCCNSESLMHYKQKLEKRMKMVEQHNARLELQLRQLRQQLVENPLNQKCRKSSASNLNELTDTITKRLRFMNESESTSLPATLTANTGKYFISKKPSIIQTSTKAHKEQLTSLFDCADDINKAVSNLMAEIVMDNNNTDHYHRDSAKQNIAKDDKLEDDNNNACENEDEFLCKL